jgi:hypothetical protein
MKRTLIGVALLASCGGKSTGTAGGGGEAKLCVDPATMPGTPMPPAQPEDASVQSEDPVFDTVVGERMKMASLVQDGVRAAVIASRCDPAPCEPRVVFVGDDGQVAAQAMLPHGSEIWQGGDYPFVVTAFQLEGSGADAAVWISYQVIGEPEAAVGSTMRDHLAVYRASDAALLASIVMGVTPEADSLEACVTTLHAVDADCDGDDDLLALEQCQLALCVNLSEEEPAPPECDGTMASKHTVHRRGTDGVYSE